MILNIKLLDHIREWYDKYVYVVNIALCGVLFLWYIFCVGRFLFFSFFSLQFFFLFLSSHPPMISPPQPPSPTFSIDIILLLYVLAFSYKFSHEYIFFIILASEFTSFNFHLVQWLYSFCSRFSTLKLELVNQMVLLVVQFEHRIHANSPVFLEWNTNTLIMISPAQKEKDVDHIYEFLSWDHRHVP